MSSSGSGYVFIFIFFKWHNSEVGKVREFSVSDFVLIFIKQNRKYDAIVGKIKENAQIRLTKIKTKLDTEIPRVYLLINNCGMV